MTKKISIFGCGVQKGGTTSLFAHFSEHPELSPPSRKELHFFDDEAQDWNNPDYSLLASYFSPDDVKRHRFDITPIYIFWPPSIARIHAYNPTAKLIFLFRDPFDRAWSQWCMEYARGSETLPFAEAIREGRDRMKDLPPLAYERRIYTYIERGRYAEQIRSLFKYFSRTQTLFLRSEDLHDNHTETLAKIAAFLGIARFPDTGPKREHKRPAFNYPSIPADSDRSLVAELLWEDIEEFARITALDVSKWSVMTHGQ